MPADFVGENGAKNKKRKWTKIILALSGVVIVFILIFAGLFFFLGKKGDIAEQGLLVDNTIQTSTEDGDSQENFFGESNESGVTVDSIDAGSSDQLKSENYQVDQMNIGGDIVFIGEENRNLPLDILFTTSESVSSGEDGKSKLLITWKTNKLAVSDLEYSRSDGQATKIIQENEYGFNHSVLLSDLEYSTAYIYRIRVQDRWGSDITSGYYGAYTGKEKDSVFELIAKAMGEIFGWALGK